MIARDGACISLWQDQIEPYVPVNRPDPARDYDVIIVGAGITGISTALLLQEAGKQCLVIEARNIGFGTTGGTTAHLNTLLDTPYPTLISNFGEDGAKKVAEAAKKAIALIKKNIRKYGIDCGFEEADAFVFSQTEDQTKELEDLYEACNTVGLEVNYSSSIPVPIPFQRAMRVGEQAKFHPILYVQALAKAFEEAGGHIVEDTRVTGVEENDLARLTTSRFSYQAKAIVFATHIPIGVNLIHLRCAPYRSYAMAVKLTDKTGYPEGLIYDSLDPYHYYRTQLVGGEPYLIAGGYDHRTAAEENTEKCFLQLEAHIRTYFNVEEIAYAWSSQYFEPADGLPYIGQLPGHSPNILVASGFGGNGMTYSSVAASVLTNMLTGKEDPNIALFDPNRIKPVAGFVNFIRHNASIAGEMLGKLIPAEKLDGLADLAHGESRIARYEGATLALHKDGNGKLHALHPQCTHLKCTVAWNHAENSWDCPCHGARFDIDGKVLTGPASSDLSLASIGK